MPRVNLLPWRDEIRRDRERRFYISLGAAAVAALLIVGTVQLYINRLVDNQTALNGILETEIAALNRQIKEIERLQAQKAALEARMEVIEGLQRIRPLSVHVFDEIVRNLPDGVFLRSLSQKNDQLELTGRAQSNARVSTFMRNIERSDWITQPELEIVQTQQEEGGKVRAFTLKARLKTGEDEDGEAQ